MAVPTEGDDILVNDPTLPVETIDALGGDDIITLTYPGDIFDLSVTTVNGGSGYDTLVINSFFVLKFATATGFDGSLRIASPVDDINSGRWDVSWTSIEEIRLTGTITNTPINLGDSRDVLDLTSSGALLTYINISTGGGDDEVRLRDDFRWFTISTGDGNDIVDVSGIDFAVPVLTQNTTINGGNGNDQLTGSYFIDGLSGDAGADRLDGGLGNDILSGGAGLDTLIGGDGNDSLDGGTGADVMLGGLGDDTYSVDDRGDIVVEYAGEGNDTVVASASFALTGGTEVETLRTIDAAAATAINLIGGSAANRIVGNAGANTLDGGGGADTLEGLGGDDTYFVDQAGDVVLEQGGGGFDRVYARADYTLSSTQELEFISAASIAATTPLRLTGNQLDNQVWGNAGANVLDGGAGADLMYGLGGNDTYVVNQQGDAVLEAVGGGIDRVNASSNYILSSLYEIEILAAANPAGPGLSLVGNHLNNTIIGTNAADTLSGGLGADNLYGGAGNDTYYLDSAGDLIVDGANSGFDVVNASISYTLQASAEIERLTATGNTAPITLVGNARANSLFSGVFGDTLDGGAGRDLLYGFGGSDLFRFTAVGDANADTIVDFASGTDRIGLEGDVFTGLAPGALPPSAFALGTTATDADDRILYDQPTGRLFFDADGNGVGSAVLFATLDSRPVIAASDFVVI